MVRPSEYDYIWVFKFPYHFWQRYRNNFWGEKQSSDGEAQWEKVATTDVVIRFWIDLREFRTGERATKAPERHTEE